MSIFNRNNSIKKRIRSLEEVIGVIWAKDVYGDYVHTKDGENEYARLPRIEREVKTIQKILEEGGKK